MTFPPHTRHLTSASSWRGRLSEEARVCAPASSYRRAGRLRPPAFAPQLKRDPLGGALPPHKHSSANSFGIVMRGAPRVETHGRAPAHRTPPLQLRPVSGAPRGPPIRVVAQKQLPKPRVTRTPVERAARSSSGARRAV